MIPFDYSNKDIKNEEGELRREKDFVLIRVTLTLGTAPQQGRIYTSSQCLPAVSPACLTQINMYLINVYLTGVHLTGVYLMACTS
jgi:hypothetical protein